MQLTGEDVEAAFVQTASEQENGEPFNWKRTAELLNARVARAPATPAIGAAWTRAPVETAP